MKSRPFHFALALIVLTFLAYSNSFQGGFVLDNRGLLLNDPRIREVSLENLRLIIGHSFWWPNGESGLYRPFTTLTWLFNYVILSNRDQPAGYHWINFLLHTGNVLLVWILAVRFARDRWQAFFVAALWAVHPALTEAVANIAGRSDLLAAGAVLGGILVYLKSVESEGARRPAWLAALAAITAVGVFSKESAVILPGAIVLYELTFRKSNRWGRAQASGLAAVLIPTAAMLYQRHSVLSGTLPMEIPFTDNPIVAADFWTGRLTALTVVARYFARIVWPVHLSADYSWSQIPLAQGDARDWIAATAALTIVPFTALLYRWNRAAFFFFCLGLAWLAPSSNLPFPIGTIMAERFLYLPALGVIMCLVPALWALATRCGVARYVPVLLGLLTAALAVRTWVRNADWKDDLSIAEASVRSSPLSFKAHDLLANVLFAADLAHVNPSDANLARAIEESEKSRSLLDALPDDRIPADPYRFAATLYINHAEYQKAIAALIRYIAVEKAGFAAFKSKVVQGRSPTGAAERASELRQSGAWMALSSAYLAAGDPGHAAEAAGHAGGADPMNPQIYRLMAESAVSAGRMDDAAVALVEGAFVTSDKSLRQALVELYQHALDPRSCALVAGPNGPAIDPACPIVHGHVCTASAYTVKTLAAVGQADLARTRKKMFVQQFGCPVAPLDQALP